MELELFPANSAGGGEVGGLGAGLERGGGGTYGDARGGEAKQNALLVQTVMTNVRFPAPGASDPALDADSREAFLQLLFAECREAGASLLFVSHDQSLAGLFDRSLSLSDLNRAALPAGL